MNIDTLYKQRARFQQRALTHKDKHALVFALAQLEQAKSEVNTLEQNKAELKITLFSLNKDKADDIFRLRTEALIKNFEADVLQAKEKMVVAEGQYNCLKPKRVAKTSLVKPKRVAKTSLVKRVAPNKAVLRLPYLRPSKIDQSGEMQTLELDLLNVLNQASHKADLFNQFNQPKSNAATRETDRAADATAALSTEQAKSNAAARETARAAAATAALSAEQAKSNAAARETDRAASATAALSTEQTKSAIWLDLLRLNQQSHRNSIANLINAAADALARSAKQVDSSSPTKRLEEPNVYIIGRSGNKQQYYTLYCRTEMLILGCPLDELNHPIVNVKFVQNLSTDKDAAFQKARKLAESDTRIVLSESLMPDLSELDAFDLNWKMGKNGVWHAKPTSEFWNSWRANKEKIKEAGFWVGAFNDKESRVPGKKCFFVFYRQRSFFDKNNRLPTPYVQPRKAADIQRECEFYNRYYFNDNVLFDLAFSHLANRLELQESAKQSINATAALSTEQAKSNAATRETDRAADATAEQAAKISDKLVPVSEKQIDKVSRDIALVEKNIGAAAIPFNRQVVKISDIQSPSNANTTGLIESMVEMLIILIKVLIKDVMTLPLVLRRSGKFQDGYQYTLIDGNNYYQAVISHIPADNVCAYVLESDTQEQAYRKQLEMNKHNPLPANLQNFVSIQEKVKAIVKRAHEQSEHNKTPEVLRIASIGIVDILPPTNPPLFNKKELEKSAQKIVRFQTTDKPLVLRALDDSKYRLVNGFFEYYATLRAMALVSSKVSCDIVQAKIIDSEEQEQAYRSQNKLEACLPVPKEKAEFIAAQIKKLEQKLKETDDPALKKNYQDMINLFQKQLGEQSQQQRPQSQQRPQQRPQSPQRSYRNQCSTCTKANGGFCEENGSSIDFAHGGCVDSYKAKRQYTTPYYGVEQSLNQYLSDKSPTNLENLNKVIRTDFVRYWHEQDLLAGCILDIEVDEKKCAVGTIIEEESQGQISYILYCLRYNRVDGHIKERVDKDYRSYVNYNAAHKKLNQFLRPLAAPTFDNVGSSKPLSPEQLAQAPMPKRQNLKYPKVPRM